MFALATLELICILSLISFKLRLFEKNFKVLENINLLIDLSHLKMK